MDPFYLQKQGIATTRLAIDPTSGEFTSPKWQRPHRVRTKKLSTYIDGSIHLTPLGWQRCRKEVLRAFHHKTRTFKDFEQVMLRYLDKVTDYEAKQMNYHDDLGYDLPMLVLTASIGDHKTGKPTTPPLKGTRKWTHLCHQSGGYCCSQQEWDVLVLKLNPLAQSLAASLLSAYDSTSITPGANFDLLEGYNKHLGQRKLRCTVDYLDFCESVFPIDPAFASRLTTSRLPKDLDTLIDWKQVWAAEEPKGRRKGLMTSPHKCWSHAHWRLFLLTENCD